MRIALVATLTLAYPLLVFLGLERLEPRALAPLLATVALARAWATRDRVWLCGSGAALVLAGVALAANNPLALKLYPVVVNAALLVVFFVSLRHPPNVVERLARASDPDLPPGAVAYTRKVTRVWCAFFVFNGGIALATALWAGDALWALYNGLVSYVLVGCLFGGEWLVRQRVMEKMARG